MIRAAQEIDYSTIIEIRRQAVLAQPETFWDAKQKLLAANYWDKPEIAADFVRRKIYVYEVENKPLAFIGWKENYLAGLFISPDFQGQKIGEKLLKLAESEISQEHSSMWLFAHPYAEAFYERHGYKKQPQTDKPFGAVLYKFEKQFPNL